MDDQMDGTHRNLPAQRQTQTHSSLEPGGSEREEHRRWIGGAIKTLICIYSDFPGDPRVVAELGRMWADDLEEFPREVIEAAITKYRRTETRRPVPAAIIALCKPKPTETPRLGAQEEIW
jgi:hypothetical protein